MSGGIHRRGAGALCLAAAVSCFTLSAAAEASVPAAKPKGLRVVSATHRTLAVAWRRPRTRPHRRYAYRLYVDGRRVGSTRHNSATVPNLQCGASYLVQVDAG